MKQNKDYNMDLDCFEVCFFLDLKEDYQSHTIHSFMFRQKLEELKADLEEKGQKSKKASILVKAKKILAGGSTKQNDEMKRGEEYGLLWKTLKELDKKDEKRTRIEWFDEFWQNDLALETGEISKEEYFIWLIYYIDTHKEHIEDAFFRKYFGGSELDKEKMTGEDLKAYSPFKQEKLNKFCPLIARKVPHSSNIREPYFWLKWLVEKGMEFDDEKQKEEFWNELLKKILEEQNVKSRKEFPLKKKEVVNLKMAEEGISILGCIIENGGDEAVVIMDRLSNACIKRKGINTKVITEDSDLLFYLTIRFRIMAVHRKAAQSFRDAGYPISTKKNENEDTKLKKNEKEDAKRNKNKPIKMISAYLSDYKEGKYTFCRKEDIRLGNIQGGVYKVFWDEDIEMLHQALNRDEEKSSCYIRLAFDPVSGCEMALVGKEVYRKLYMENKAFKNYFCEKKGIAVNEFKKKFEEEFDKIEEKYCYDFLFLNARTMQLEPHSPGKAKELCPRFLDNKDKNYNEVLAEFGKYLTLSGDPRRPFLKNILPKWYWDELNATLLRDGDQTVEDDILPPPREAIAMFNQEMPEFYPKFYPEFDPEFVKEKKELFQSYFLWPDKDEEE